MNDKIRCLYLDFLKYEMLLRYRVGLDAFGNCYHTSTLMWTMDKLPTEGWYKVGSDVFGGDEIILKYYNEKK